MSRKSGRMSAAKDIGFSSGIRSLFQMLRQMEGTRARRDSNPRSQPSEGCALSSYATGAGETSTRRVGRRSRARDVLEEIQLVVHERPIEFAYAIRMPEEVRPRVREIFAGAIRHVVRYLDLLHLSPIDGVRTEIARNRRH